MTTSSTPISAHNGRISREYEAELENIGRVVLVGAVWRHSPLRQYANAVSRRKSDQRRRAAAKRYARKYVPRGPQRVDYLTELILCIADRITEARRELRQPGSKDVGAWAAAALVPWQSYSWGDGPAVGGRVRRVRDSHIDRLCAAGKMVARRGSGHCINLECSLAADDDSDYCAGCAVDPDIQRDHNLRRKAIDELWTAVLAPRRPGEAHDPHAGRTYAIKPTAARSAARTPDRP